MAQYVDGFVLVVPTVKNEEYRKMAESGKELWMKHGALGYFECSGDDMIPQEMGGEKARAFPEMAGAKEDETVWFSFIIFKDKAHRDAVNAKVMEEMGQQADQYKDMEMPFAMNRMAYGGFQAQVVGE